jgi:DNA-binding GntR family transcriptional regulator
VTEGVVAEPDAARPRVGGAGSPDVPELQALGDGSAGDGREESLGMRAYRVLRHRLITLALHPGERVTESQLAQELGLGHTPVREALALLVRDGLVTSRPRVGYVVTPITVQGVADLFDLRLIVEPGAARLASGKIGALQLERLESLCDGPYRQDDPESIDRFLDNNLKLHVGIAWASGNRRLASVVAELLEESRRIFHLSHRQEPSGDRFIREHRDLLRSLRDGDPEEASRLAYEHIAKSRDECIATLISDSRLMDLPLTLPAVRRLRNG